MAQEREREIGVVADPRVVPLLRELLMKLIVINHVTLDGVMQAPGRSDEDTRDGFELGGWSAAYGDEVW